MPPERLQILLRVLRELYEPENDDGGRAALPGAWPRARWPSWTPPSRRAPTASPGGMDRRLRWEGATRARSRARRSGWAPVRRRGGAAARDLRADLRPYQRQGLAWLQHLRAPRRRRRAGRRHGPGQDAADHRPPRAPRRRPAGWTPGAGGGADQPGRQLAARAAPGSRRTCGCWCCTARGRHRLLVAAAPHADVVHHHLPGAAARRGDAGRPASSTWLILDEAQAIKNPRSQAHQAALKPAGPPPPLPVGHAGREQPGRAVGAVRVPATRACWATPSGSPTASPARSSARGTHERLADLRAQVAPFILRRTKEEVARELPPKTEIVRPVELRGGPARSVREHARGGARGGAAGDPPTRGWRASTIAILDALMKLRQVCCDPRLLPGEARARCSESAKYELLMELVAPAARRRPARAGVLAVRQHAGADRPGPAPARASATSR